MARGKSGRIVLEIDPTQKDELYKALALDGLTLKEWFLQRVGSYIDEARQPSLFLYTPGISRSENRVVEEKSEYDKPNDAGTSKGGFDK